MSKSHAHIDRYQPNGAPRRNQQPTLSSFAPQEWQHVPASPKTRVQSHYEQEVKLDGHATNTMTPNAIRAFYCAKRIVASLAPQTPLPELSNAHPNMSEDFYTALAIGIRHYLQPHEFASGQE